MFRDQDHPVSADLHEHAACRIHPTEPCTCCSPLFAEIAAEQDWDQLTDPEHWASKSGDNTVDSPVGTLILSNARILTMDDSNTEATCIAFKNGQILAVGNLDDMPQSDPDLEIIDCDGKTILPGFVEPHFHFLPCANLEQFTNVGPFRFETVEQALAELRVLSDTADHNEWVMGRQFDPSLQEGPELLTRELLDTVSTSNPVFVYNASLHFAYCNEE